MTRAPVATRFIGFLAFALGLLALSAGQAAAEPGTFWTIEGSPLTGALSVQAQASLGSNATLLTKVGSTEVAVLCTKLKLVDGLLKTLGDISGKLHFEGCITKLNGITAEACVPHSSGAANGLVETNSVDGLLGLHKTAEKTRVDLYELLAKGGTFVTLVLGKAAPEKNECAIGEKYEIAGKAFLKDTQDEGSAEKVSHSVQTGPLTALKFGSNGITLDGSADVTLTGAHEGMNWGGFVPPLGYWQVEGEAVPDELDVLVAATELEKGDGILLTKIGASTMEVLCTSFELRGALLKSLGTLFGKFHYEGCITKLNGKVTAACKPRSPGAVSGLIETNLIEGLIQLHELNETTKVDLLKLVPAEGVAFVTLDLGALCPLFSKLDLTGEIFVKDAQNEGLVEKVSHLVEEGPLSRLLFGANPMTLDGSVIAALAGSHAGMKWSGFAL